MTYAQKIAHLAGLILAFDAVNGTGIIHVQGQWPDGYHETNEEECPHCDGGVVYKLNGAYLANHIRLNQLAKEFIKSIKKA